MLEPVLSPFTASILSGLVTASFAWALQGCAFDPQSPGEEWHEEVTDTAAPITNTDPSADPAYVLRLYDNCTAFAISQHYVLTAAHCLGFTGVTLVRLAAGKDAETVVYEKAATVAMHPEFTGAPNQTGFDIGIIRLAGLGLGASFPRVRLHSASRAPWTSVGEQFSVAGYGAGSNVNGAQNCADAGAPGQKRWGSFAFTGQGTVNGEGIWTEVIGSDPSRTVCGGDSGGPFLLLRYPENFAFAVTARSSLQAGKNVFGTLIEPHMGWIREESGKMGLPLVCTQVRDHRVRPTLGYYDCSEQPPPRWGGVVVPPGTIGGIASRP